MIQLALVLLLTLAGCSHYEEKKEEVQIGTTFLYHPDKKIVPQYPFPLLVSSLELDDCLQKGGWKQGNCSFQLFSAQWLYLHKEGILADTIIDNLLENQHCELIQEPAQWWWAWSQQQKTYWNSSMLMLSEIAQNPTSKMYAASYSSVQYAHDKRNTSVANLSAAEQEIIDQFKKYSDWMEQIPSKEVFEKASDFPKTQLLLNMKYKNAEPYERLIVLYDNEISEAFINQLFYDFECQHVIKELYFLSPSQDADLINQLLENKEIKTFLLCYHLQKEIPKEWQQTVHASLSLGDHFSPQRSQDYHSYSLAYQFLSQLERGQNFLKPQLVIYDDEYEHLLEHPMLQSVAYKLKITQQDYRDQLTGLLALPERQSLFQPYLKNAVYINQPRSLPYNVLLLLKPSLLRQAYPFLRYWHQERPLLMGPPESLSGIDTLDSALKGLLIPVAPRTRHAQHFCSHHEAQDILALVTRWPWFQYYQGYIYEGELGRYRLKDQQLQCEWDMLIYAADKE